MHSTIMMALALQQLLTVCAVRNRRRPPSQENIGFLKISVACLMNLNTNFAGENDEKVSKIEVNLEGLYI